MNKNSSVLSSWLSKFKRWCPQLKVVRLHSTDTDERNRLRKALYDDFGSYDVVVATYEIAKNKIFRSSLVQSIHWRVLVLDEGHMIKSKDTELSQVVRKMHFQWSILLTGTPLQNNLTELWALLNFLHPDIFEFSEPFDAAFNLTEQKVDTETLQFARRLLKPLMIRRLKVDVETNLPEKVEVTVSCPLSEAQLFFYRKLLLKDSSLLSRLDKQQQRNSNEESNSVTSNSTDFSKLKSLMMQLRKCCNHPYLFSGVEDDEDQTDVVDLVTASGKLAVLDRLLIKLKTKGHRCVLFSQFTRTLDILEDYCNIRGWEAVRLDGGTNRIQRNININAFNAPMSKSFIFLMSTRAGGMGINLQTADTCILYDSDWNPQADLQAMARVHRIGQTRKVHVYRLVSAGTIEERILQRAQKKLYLDQMVNKGSEKSGEVDGAEELEKLGTQEMLKMLTFGADKILSGQGNKYPVSICPASLGIQLLFTIT